MRQRPFRIAALGFAAFSLAGAAHAYNPPPGGLIVPLLGSPYALSTGPTVTAVDAPWADRLNPSASAAQQRPVLDAGYSLFSAFDGTGSGSGLVLGISLPQPWAVLGAGLRFVSTSLETGFAMPLGTFIEARGTIAKDLYPDLFVGAGLSLSLGGDGGFGWGLGLDLGMMHRVGDLGFLKDFRWGAVLSGIGKGYDPTGAVAGMDGSAAGSFPAPFTLAGGARALLIRTDAVKAGLGLDLSFPSFQDLGLNLSASLTWKDFLVVRTAWGLDLRELIAGSGRSLVPSLGIGASIPIEWKGELVTREGWERSEARPSLAVAPVYGKAFATSLGVSLPLGVIDRKPPEIELRFPASAWGPAYVSPNADGVQDGVEMGLAITDQRYIQAWSLLVRDASGAVVRTVSNKESRPETAGFQGVLARLLYVRKGVPVPERLSWNGVLDSGETAADGEYAILVSSTDDNGNRAETAPSTVVIDTTPPAATLTPPSPGLVFSPDGDGNKDVLPLSIGGSAEDSWKGRVLDAAGATIQSLEWKAGAPLDFSWDGRTEAGPVVPDGVYAFVLSATDRAGNAFTTRIDNIIINTQQPPINLTIDASAFSPNGDGLRDTITLSPGVPVRTGLVSFRLAVLDRDKREVWSVQGQDTATLGARFAFEGKDAAGKVLPEGSYQARLAVSYVNGHSPSVLSPFFLLDVTPPLANVASDRAAFNPAGREGQNLVTFSQSATREERWTGEVLAGSGVVVRGWTFGAEPAPAVEWDGNDDAGVPLPDGQYSYRLRSQDRAGNSFTSVPAGVSLDTERKAVRLSADIRAFSPDGDGQKDSVRLSAQVQSNERIRDWELVLVPADAASAAAGTTPAATVRSWKGKGAVPETTNWDGRGGDGARVPDGRYVARLRATYVNDDLAEASTAPVLLDTAPPSVSVSAAPLLFSPNGDGRRDEIRFTQKSAPGDDWQGSVLDAGGKNVRSWSWQDRAVDFSWDGTDDAGNRLPDGNYRYEVASADAAGNRGRAAVGGIVLDSRVPQVFVTAAASGLSPNGDGFLEDLAFSLIVNLREGISGWKFSLVDRGGSERAAFSGEGGEVPSRIVWDGKDSSGRVAEGEFAGMLAVGYEKGDLAEARTGSITVDITPPEAVISLSPPFFSPDNDGVDDELSIDIAVTDLNAIDSWKIDIVEASVEESAQAVARERLFASWSGRGLPARRIAWDGRSTKGELVVAATDYPFSFEVRDVWGNGSRVGGKVAVDVLVIREGDRLKINIPSIVFRPNFADFNGLAPDQLERNDKVIKRIAEILNKFRDYRIQIEGHANSISKIYGYTDAKVTEEEQKELLPLSTARAELVRTRLVEYGVDAKRLTVVGLGSSRPVVDFKDAVNRWKNRRVEFTLIKNQ